MRFLAISAFAAAATSAAELPPPAAREVDFVRDVQPIFKANCVKCHGPEKQKSDYRLDVKAVALTGGEGHAPNIVPGESADSPLIKFVAGSDDEMKMPPKGERLSAEQIALLRRWIDDGAHWPDAASAKVADPRDWWSLKPLRKPKSGGTIDAFITAKLAEKGLAMSPEADPRTLIRRLYFDLTGLPPTPEEVARFVEECRDGSSFVFRHSAFEALVDRLLASPAYGERWARHWLDVVHYGDTHGYDKDQPRPNAWPYRDYVIRALNEDKPYTRFVQEQLAGDVLFPGTRDGIEALGFIAAGPWDLIGHAEVPEEKIDGKIARHLDRDDMVGNAIGTFTSVTVQCAQCHNHKFDPVTQDDYYSLHAVFAALDRADRKYHADDQTNARFLALEKSRAANEHALAAIKGPLRAKAGEPFAALTRRIEGASKAKQGNTNPDFGYHAAISPVQDAVKWVQVDLGARTELERVTLLPCYDDFNNIGAGFGFPVRFKIEVSDDAEFRSGVKQFWRDLDRTLMADFPNPKLAPFSTHVAKDDGLAGRFVRITATKLAPRQNDFIFSLAEVRVFDTAGKNVAQGKAVTALDSIEAPPRWRKANLTDGIAPVAASADEKEKLLAEREALLLSHADDGTKTKRAALLAEQKDIAAQLAALPPAQVVFAGTVHTGSGTFKGTGANGGKPRKIHLLARGQVTTPGREMQPAALAMLDAQLPSRFDLAPDAAEGARRAALAQWIVNPKNPLTWRSIVNRVWLYHFGHGIVDTPNDFGRMGAFPTHPELLDWLAVTFRDDMGGSLKKLHKQIVMSAAWRQASETRNEKAVQMDSGNTLLWRQNRRKLEAEAVRDAVLAVSGKLDVKAGGPGWRDFVVKFPEHSPHYKYDLADPNDPQTWRRSIFRFIVRSQMQPFMTVLDCADPSMRVDKRNESVSPGQALALLNNGFIVAQAAHFAERMRKDAGPEVPAQIERAFRLATGRAPLAEEKSRLTGFAQQHGMANACRVILNLNEFTFVD